MHDVMHLLMTSVVKNATACGGTTEELAQFNFPQTSKTLLLTEKDSDQEIIIPIEAEGRDGALVASFYQDFGKQKTVGACVVYDKIIASRIRTYLTEYYGKKRTNCATLTHFLKTGTFKECGHYSMRAFAMEGDFQVHHGQDIEIGDRVCVLYYESDILARPGMEWVKEQYQDRVENVRDNWGRYQGGDTILMASEICDEYNLGIYADFHFLTCIGHFEGAPVFIQQMGIHDPATGNTTITAPVILSVGTVSVSQHEPVAYAFVQKR